MIEKENGSAPPAAGIRILEFSGLGPTPFGAMLLAAWLYQARAKGPWRPLHGVALYRLLALVYAHADAPAR